MPMHPSPMAETSKLLVPSLRFCMIESVNQLTGSANNWLNAQETLCRTGASNIVTRPLVSGTTNQFYQVRQR